MHMDCDWKESFMSSAFAGNTQNEKQVPYDINLRIVCAFREIGKGHKAMLCNIDEHATSNGKNELCCYQWKVLWCIQCCSEKSVKEAAKELNDTGRRWINWMYCKVPSISWLYLVKRGFPSLNGVVTLLSSKAGKYLDFHVLSKKCKSCEHWSKKTNHHKYGEWKLNHHCQINHAKSAGSIESSGALLLFPRSVEKHHLQYNEYVGDGDSSSFHVVESAKPYGDNVKIEKRNG